ncbi:GRF1-interacting factor 1-like [Impatiens glandulifera]|uniref:GRF1-interacting factor 1-like n=1 Tax=Impatiens glandulifera TaxID=253017 RepID=UPI001FB13612|nr:GRF1-interacting factor 1-like [Impatiens glandulifera]
MMADYYPANATTDHIQQYLDENKALILKIVECQNLGKPNECAEYQARFQKNLMYLASVADSHPHPPGFHSHFRPGGIFHRGAQQKQQHMNAESLMAARSSMLHSQQQLSALHQHQALHGQLGMSSVGNTDLHMLPTEANSSGTPDSCRAGESRGITVEMRLNIVSDERRREIEIAEALYMKSGEDDDDDDSS